jgi:hypothetical protein
VLDATVVLETGDLYINMKKLLKKIAFTCIREPVTFNIL